MTDKAKKIYKVVADEKICDRFARPCAAVEIFTNPAQLFLDGQKDRMARICCDGIGLSYNKMSDYERFCTFINALPKMAGSGAYELFFEELSMLFGYDYSTEINARELWESLCEQISQTAFKLDMVLNRCYGAEHTNSFLPILYEGKNYSEFVDINLKKLASVTNGIVGLDVSDIDFSVTDKYHADMAYRAYLEGDDSHKDIIASALLYSICENSKKSDICLYLYIGDNYSSARTFISYFKDRGILPNITLFASDSICYRVAKELCGMYEVGSAEIRIDCGLVYCEGDTVQSIADKAKSIARVYPVGELVIGGSLSTAPVFAAADELVKKGIAEALADICNDVQEAIICFAEIIKNSK